MIKTYAYDVEVLPNFFSIVIVDLNDYLKVFANAVDEKGKPVPLTDLYSVAEIKRKISQVSKQSFWISDTDDSQLVQMIGYINNLNFVQNPDGSVIRHDLFGYNSSNYDKLMVAGLLMNFNTTNSTKELITKLYNLSKHLINLNKELKRSDYLFNTVSKFPLPYLDIDVMTIFALNKCGKGVNSKGETVYFPKSLKQTSINIKWYELLEHELPAISDIDNHYYHKDLRYKSMSNDELNLLIDKWDRYIIHDWISDVMHYNENDVFIVCEMVRLYLDEIKLRYNITRAYDVNVMSSSRSDIADKLFIKFYSEFSGLSPTQWRGRKTERTKLSFNKVILPNISFKTDTLKELLAELKRVVIHGIGKKSIKNLAEKDKTFKFIKTDSNGGWFEVDINGLKYTIATGGIHTQDIPGAMSSKVQAIDSPSTGEITWDNMTDDSYVYVHVDVASYYPSIMAEYEVCPDHIQKSVFVKLVRWLKDMRVTAKHSKETHIDGIEKEVFVQVLKIVINSIYGKLGYEYGDICDKLAVLKVTINGQLMLLMLCEELELNGIKVLSANTDGIIVKLHKRNREVYNNIINKWQEDTKMMLDSEDYDIFVTRDINNYAIRELNGKMSYKGALNPYMHLINLDKGYDMPIVAKAVINFFFNDIPIMETLYSCTNILDFCKTQNIGRGFKLMYYDKNTGTECQRNSRYYVSVNGGKLYKENDVTKSSLCGGNLVRIINTLDDFRIEHRGVDYMYYYNECIKIIDPIKLRVSPNMKGNKYMKSGKAIIKQNSEMYKSLFDDYEDW